jgi:hypothetical protein
MEFFVGLHQPSDARHVDRCMVSVARLRNRRSDFTVNEWMLDSGAFSEVTQFGGYRDGVEVYAAQIDRWSRCGTLVAAVAQDYMCEPFVTSITGLTVAEHQRLTTARYDALMACRPSTYILPVIQGYQPDEYAQHVRDYGDRLAHGAWVGVGSVCKRNADPLAILRVLDAIHAVRPDLRLHGFGVKLTSLNHPAVRGRLYSADSMAWSFAARKAGRSANDWREAVAFADRVNAAAAGPRQLSMMVA